MRTHKPTSHSVLLLACYYLFILQFRKKHTNLLPDRIIPCHKFSREIDQHSFPILHTMLGDGMHGVRRHRQEKTSDIIILGRCDDFPVCLQMSQLFWMGKEKKEENKLVIVHAMQVTTEKLE
jgi:hypothetical protein